MLSVVLNKCLSDEWPGWESDWQAEFREGLQRYLTQKRKTYVRKTYFKKKKGEEKPTLDPPRLYDFSTLLNFIVIEWEEKKNKTLCQVISVLCCAKLLWLCLTLCDCSPSGSSVHGILQARTLKWLAIAFSKESSPFRDRTCIFCSSCIAGGSFIAWSTRGAFHFYIIPFNSHYPPMRE